MVKVLSFKFQHIWVHLPCCFLKDPLKRDFLDIDLTKFLWVRKFGNTSAMRVIFFEKCSKFKPNFKSGEKKSENVFSF